MTWEQVLTLLHIAHMTNEYPKLHALRNSALDALETADLEALGFHGHADQENE